MIELGLTPAQRRTYESTLAATHDMRVEITVLDRNENVIGPLGVAVISGSVSVDADADVSRSLDLVCLDPGSRFQWAPDTPSDTGLYADNFLAVRFVVSVPGVGDVAVPVFWGPITSVQRNATSLSVSALSKEYLYLSPHTAWTSQKIEDRTPVHEAIRRILAAAGEKRLQLRDQKPRLADPVVVAGGSEPWKVARLIAANAGRHLFYDGLGRARLREYPRDASYVYRTGANGNVLSPPAITYDISNVRNAVEVLGPVTKGPTPRPRVTAVADRSHPLSPWSLSRNGVPRYMVHRIELDKTVAKTRMLQMARTTLTDRLLAEVAVEFSALPAPHIEPMDMAALVMDDMAVPFRCRQFTIPLTATDSASVGFVSRTRVSRRVVA